MGAVYRATDTKLNRDVAIKILPGAFADDPERLMRFTREAQVLASLNHPNIASIYGIEDRAIIMELVEGPTLDSRIDQGPMDPAGVLSIARQIAAALEAAHEKGIIHRDLKPANVKLTPDGAVKVLDFGLAKLSDPTDPGENPQSAPTIVKGHSPTMTGMILGTAAYMAPEQARGQVIDKRADIWSFGVVLFELLSGKQLFEGDSVSDVLAEVLKKEIPWASLPPATPANLRWLLQRCLERDRKARLRDIADAWAAPVIPAPAPPPPAPRRTPWAMLAATAVAAAAVTFAVTAWLRPPATALPQLRYTIQDPTETTSSIGTFAISPDGRRLAFTARDRNLSPALWIRNLDSLETRKVLNGISSSFFWAPDSRSVAVHNTEGKLWRIDLDKDTRQSIADVPVLVSGSWSQSGRILYSDFASQQYLLDPAIGFPEKLPRGKSNASRSVLLPDGEHLLGLSFSRELSWRSLRGGTSVNLMQGPSAFAFVKGKLLTLTASKLSAQPFDARTGKLSGQPAVIGSQVSAFSASENGILVFREGGNSTFTQLTLVDRAGKTIAAASGGSHNELSPDGRFMAYDVATPTGERDVWILDLKRDLRQRLTHAKPGSREWIPSWFPDSKTIFFVANRKGRLREGEIYTRLADGSGGEQLFLDTDSYKHHTQISPDGSTLAFDGGESEDNTDIFLVPFNVPVPQRQPKPFLNGPYSESQPQFSPDGKLLAYISAETGAFEVYVHTLTGQPKRWRISPNGGVSPR
ncbi:MAG: protein kinase, partial [Acidobacteria bacterium]|nr:protein kinase [Acidobacteriota bacterium]